jgi:PAS domain S-box-containing protein
MDSSDALSPTDPLAVASRRQMLALMLEAAPTYAAIYRWPDLQLGYANDAMMARLNPGGRADSSRMNLFETIGLSSVQKLNAEILPQVRVLGRWTGDCFLRDVWGSEFPVTTCFLHRPGGREQREGYLCLVAVRVLELYSAEKPTARDDDLLRALMDTVPDAVYFKDLHSRFVRVSRALAQKDGYDDPSIFIGKTDFDRFTIEHAQPAYEAEQRIIRTGEPILNLEEKETWPDGHTTWVSTSKFPLRDATGSVVGTFGISRDVTVDKLAESERQEMEMQLQLSQKMESIGRLAAGVAHEVNTPTQFIADNTHFLTDAFGKIEAVLRSYRALRDAVAARPECAEALKAISATEAESEVDYLAAEIPRCLKQSLEGLTRVSRIVCSLKEFAHPNSPELAPADLNRVIETSLVVSRHEWKYVADVVTELDPMLPPVPCVVDEFNQVILNLVINAAHAIGDALKQRGEAKGRITVRTRQEGDSAIVEVEDTGTGVPVEIRHRIFEPFFTTKAVGKGTGQGLAIVHTVIVKHHHGSVDLTSELGQGTKFILRLPLTAAVPAASNAS